MSYLALRGVDMPRLKPGFEHSVGDTYRNTMVSQVGI